VTAILSEGMKILSMSVGVFAAHLRRDSLIFTKVSQNRNDTKIFGRQVRKSKQKILRKKTVNII